MYYMTSDFEMQTPIMAIIVEHQSAVELRHSSDNCKEASVRDAQVPHVLNFGLRIHRLLDVKDNREHSS